MNFIGLIDRVEDGQAYIIIQDGMFEISVPLGVLENSHYKAGDWVTVKMDTNIDGVALSTHVNAAEAY